MNYRESKTKREKRKDRNGFKTKLFAVLEHEGKQKAQKCGAEECFTCTNLRRPSYFNRTACCDGKLWRRRHWSDPLRKLGWISPIFQTANPTIILLCSSIFQNSPIFGNGSLPSLKRCSARWICAPSSVHTVCSNPDIKDKWALGHQWHQLSQSGFELLQFRCWLFFIAWHILEFTYWP